MIDRNPKIFISYAWGNEDVKERVRELAERLLGDGIDVVLDIWDLREGQDKYVFMEKTVNDETIDKVLIICDKVYKNKADDRVGGVGDETTVISPEVYNNHQQSKFIPIVFERDDNGNVFLPAYLKSRMFVDLSENGEDQYEQLVRTLYEKPLYKKPSIGKIPKWLSDDNVREKELKTVINKLKKANGKGQVEVAKKLEKQFIDQFIYSLNLKTRDDIFDSFDVIDKIDALKEIRDDVFDFVEELSVNDEISSDFITSLIERSYNEVPIIDGGQYSQTDFECYDYLRWEMFIGITTILLHYELYDILHQIIVHTYFLRSSYFEGSEQNPSGYIGFNKYLTEIEEKSNSHFDKNYYSKSAYLLCGREKYPILTKNKMAEADLLLYQMSTMLEIVSNNWIHIWFPYMYAYAKNVNMWKRLLSRTYCEKVMPLFGVRDIDGLKRIISNAKHDKTVKYTYAYEGAPNIHDYIKINDIGTLE